jgi:hypothetical protein
MARSGLAWITSDVYFRRARDRASFAAGSSMFVLLGPSFEGTRDAYQLLAQATGLVAYDLHSRLRKGVWGVVKLLGDAREAEALARALREHGFTPVLIERSVLHDSERRPVPASSVRLGERELILELSDRELHVDYGALAVIVRGEVQPGRVASAINPSSGSLRAVVPGPDTFLRDPQKLSFEGYQAADLHFREVPWIARLGLRGLDPGGLEHGPRALDALVDEIAGRANVRVDRGARTSSVAAFVEQPAPLRSHIPTPASLREQPDERFDPYSRVIGEAERQLRALSLGA